jgi:hypothetical protein
MMKQVDLNCWLSNPDVQDFVWRHNMTSVRDLERHYCSHIVKSANAQNRTAVVWQEIFDNGAASGPDHTVVHVWMDEWQRRLSAVTEAGYGALLSSCATSLLCAPSTCSRVPFVSTNEQDPVTRRCVDSSYAGLGTSTMQATRTIGSRTTVLSRPTSRAAPPRRLW